VHQGLASASQDIGDIDTALKEYKKSVEISRQHGMIDYEMSSLVGLAWTMWWTPVRTMKDEVIRFYEEGIRRAREVGSKATESTILSFKGSYVSILGRRYPETERYKANEILAEAERMAGETGDQYAIFLNRSFRALSERWLGRPKKAIELTEGLVEALRGTSKLMSLPSLMSIRGLALAEYGQIEDGIELLRDGIDICEKLGGVLMLGRLYNTLGYCYAEIHHPERAWPFNLQSREIARKHMEQYPMGREVAGEHAAQADVNLMENLFDQGRMDEAWHRIEFCREEWESLNYDRNRDQRGSRMDYLAAQILLHRNDRGQAEVLIRENLERVREQNAKKREGGFLRLLGEVQIRRNESDNAVKNLNEAIFILKEVGNPRQLWLAHSSLASVYGQLDRLSEAREQWAMAAEVIHRTAKGVSNSELREGFLKAEPVRRILSKATS
jgi:tetratricopeptide (TPR) repeat protein